MATTRNDKLAGLFVNPFRPGYGQRPPHLAGRKNEIYDIFKHVGATANGELVARDVVIYGPRGSGKTALLRVVGEELEKLGVNATLELMTATDMQSAEDARRELIGVVGQPLWEALKPQEWGLDWRGVQAKWQRGELSRSEVRKGLVAKCKSKPLILLIDEAHLMSPGACGELLNEVLTIRGRGGPVIVVLAGKPKLAELGNLSEVSFLERGEIMSLGLLDEQSSGDAVRIPLGETGIGISETALRRVVDDCQGYPQFLQLWGSALWRRASESGTNRLDDSDVSEVEPAMRLEREEIYLGRFAGWKGADRELLVDTANDLARNGWVERPKLEAMVKGLLIRQNREPDDCGALVDQMVESDFLWRPRGQPRMLPALPSFVSVVANQGRSR
ncbi:MAG: ATP-binding protein [Gammaproteobacteria bacterium]|nr:ATP-binding protein [Gammaproteobacteria bacterium]